MDVGVGVEQSVKIATTTLVIWYLINSAEVLCASRLVYWSFAGLAAAQSLLVFARKHVSGTDRCTTGKTIHRRCTCWGL